MDLQNRAMLFMQKSIPQPLEHHIKKHDFPDILLKLKKPENFFLKLESDELD